MKKYYLLLLLILALTAQARPELLTSLGLAAQNEVPPDVDTAFVFSVSVANPETITAHWDIAEGNYLYRDKIRFEILANDAVTITDVALPAGENKLDDLFGLTEVYPRATFIDLPLARSGQQAQQITLKAHYQGCSETFRICYPPVTKEVSLSLPAVTTNTSAQIAAPAAYAEQDRIAQSLAQDNLITILFSFLGLGLLLAFTPCIFPMIPILSSIIVGEGEHITTQRAFILSLTYVLAMSVTYTSAGVLTGLLGENIQAILQNPWIIASFSGLFIILALSMFGLFELQLPHILQHRLHQITHQQQGGHIAGAAIMGLLSGLIVGPCLAPPLAAALIFIGQQGDPILGGSALFALSLGMGIPLLIIGTSAGSLLPKAGSWMNTIKAIFGVLMLALAIGFLGRIIPAWISLLLWGGFLMVLAIYLGALTTLAANVAGWQKLVKGLGLILLVYGSLLMIGGASGGTNLWQPLTVISNGTTAQPSASLHFSRINNLAELDAKLAQSAKPTILDLYADWCVDCKRMEATTFKDQAVKQALANTQLLKLDVTENTAEHSALLKHFGLFGPPTLLFFDAKGREYKQYRLVGMVSAVELLQHLAKLPPTAQ